MQTQKYDSTRGRKSLKLLDRYLGIPIILLLSFFCKKRDKPPTVSHIGLLKTGAIGDTVLILGILQDIYEEYPNAKITVFVGSSNACMAEFMPNADVVVLPVTNPLKSIKLMRQKKCDIMVDFGQWPRLDALLSAFSGALFTVGFQTSGQFRSALYDAAIPHDQTVHEYRNFKSLVTTIGIQRENIPYISLSRDRHPKRTVAIHMFPGGSQAELKKWPRERWIELIDLLTAEGLTIVLTGAKADVPATEAVKERVKQPELVLIKAGSTLKATCEELYDSDLVISVDTGIAHIAAALGCNIVSLHGPAPVSRWGPISNKATCLTPSEDCLGCVYLGFEVCTKRRQCINDITVEQVSNAVKKSLLEHSLVLDSNCEMTKDTPLS
jgi:ADP-heptose:LPS heptosyltransferase